MTASNPFYYGGAVPPHLFYGRAAILQNIVHKLSAPTPQSVSILGERRMGKSSLLRYIESQKESLLPHAESTIIIYLDLMRGACHTRRGLMRVVRRALTRAWREPWPKEEDGDLEAFDFALEDLQGDGLRLVLCLDEMENLTKRPSEFDDLLEAWRASGSAGQVAMLTASAQSLAALCAAGNMVSPFYNIFTQEQLGLLDVTAWQQLIRDGMSATAEELAFMQRIAGHHPFFSQMAASYLWQAREQAEPDYQALADELHVQMLPYLQTLWGRLTTAEQVVLYHCAGDTSLPYEAELLPGLVRRGLIDDNKPFSAVFAEMIMGNLL